MKKHNEALRNACNKYKRRQLSGLECIRLVFCALQYLSLTKGKTLALNCERAGGWCEGSVSNQFNLIVLLWASLWDCFSGEIQVATDTPLSLYRASRRGQRGTFDHI